MKITWTTDLHLNFLNDYQIKRFCEKINKTGAEALFITGDVSEAPHFVIHMRMVEMFCNMPIYFICGNHDYYRGSVKKFRLELNKQFGSNCPPNNTTYWMNEHGVITLKDGVAVVGSDGWYDGGYSSFLSSKLSLSDFHLIEELRHDSLNTFRHDHFNTVFELAEEGAQHAEEYIKKAFENHDVVYYLTHAPPFRDNSRAPDGKLSNADWLPYFSSKFMGDAILKAMDGLPEAAELIVLCGHTHTYWKNKPRKNITCITGGGDYRRPEICGVFEI
jgi:Icc-related predicted phosphoesterase